MNLERYNRGLFALLGTGLLLGGVALAVGFAVSEWWPDSDQGVIVDAGGKPKPKQNLVLCSPVTESGGAFQYIPVGVVVADDADRSPVLGLAKRVGSASYAVGDCFIGSNRVFNVVVRDLTTGDQRLLLDAAGQVESLSVPGAKCADGEGDAPCGLLLWAIRSDDTNKDGAITGSDATTAYVSDLAARALSRMTPNDATVIALGWNHTAGTWDFRIRRDANGDGRFSMEDGSELIEAKVSPAPEPQPVVKEAVLARLRQTIN